MAKKPSKSETLTIRLDPKTRFMLEFVSRLRGQTITTVVERAITEAANRATIESIENDYSRGGNTTLELSWRDFWSISDGERALKMAEKEELHPTFDEEKRFAFAKEHWPFFWASSSRIRPQQHFIDILWPRIDEFIAIHEQERSQDYFAAGKAMQNALQDAKLKAPEWPQPKPPPKASRELDDEIPF